ncbi:MAG TPA: hypothetical protein VIJ23_00180 [Mycobacterium sp.]
MRGLTSERTKKKPSIKATTSEPQKVPSNFSPVPGTSNAPWMSMDLPM